MQIKEGELTLLTFCTCKWSDKNTEIKIKKNPTKGVSNPRNPTSRSADVSLFYHRMFLSDKYFTKRRHIHTRLVRADAVTDVRSDNLKMNFETKLIR